MGRRPNLRRLSSAYVGASSVPTPPAQGKNTFGVRSLSFGLYPSQRSFSCEWTREGRGVDKVWLEKRLKDGKVLLVVRMWDQTAPTTTDPEWATSIRVVVEVESIDNCRSVTGGSTIFLRLSRPPTFETVAVRLPYQRNPLPRQVPSFDADHARVAGYTSRAVRIEFRARVELAAFLVEADQAGFPRVLSATVALDPVSRCNDEALAIFQSWLLTLDFQLAFQLEKLVQNGLMDPVKAVGLRVMVDSYVEEKGVRAAERVLALFADRLGALEPTQNQARVNEAAREKEKIAPAASSSSSSIAVRHQPRETERLWTGPARRMGPSFVDGRRRGTLGQPVDPDERAGPAMKKRRKSEPAVRTISSSESDSDSEDEVIVIGATLPFFRGVLAEQPVELSVTELRTLLTRAIADSSSLGQLLANAPESQLVRQITITPTRFLLSGPVLNDTNTITRGSGQPQNFLSVAVRTEDGGRINDRNGDLLESRFKPIFRNGFELGGRSWKFLAWSSSGLKNGSCFFVSPYSHDGQLVTPESIHRSIGDFRGTETGVIPAKYMARIAQAFSSSKPTIELDPSQILLVPDLESPSGSCFSDGVGLISTALAADVVKALKLKLGRQQKPPTCFQFRMGGAKGMLQVDPELQGKVVALRPSQIKFKSVLTHLEIAGTFDAGQAFLNRPLITLLENLGVAPQRFLDLQSAASRQIRKARSALPSAIRLLQDWNLATGTSFPSTLAFLAGDSSAATSAFLNPFVARCLDAAVVHALRDMKYAGRIPLPGCYNLVGVLDVAGCLAADEVYVRLTRKDGSNEYLSGTVAISRSPTNHPGDLRLVRAVGKLPKGVGDRIRGLTNCVVFPCRGARSLPSMLAGGDLDGDVYLLLTKHSGLVPLPARIVSPAAYDPSPTVKLDREVTIADGADFFFQFVTRDRTGLVAIRQLHLADVHPEGLYHPDCIKLAQLHSDCVDSAKSGTFVPYDALPRIPARGWPDFLTNDAPNSYRSLRANGQLYRAIGDVAAEAPAMHSGTSNDPLTDVDPFRTLTAALAALPLRHLASSRLPKPSPAAVTEFRAYLASFSAELFKLLALSPRTGGGAAHNDGLAEEALFLSVSLGTRKLDKNDKLNLSRRREQASELFALVRRLMRDSRPGAGADWGGSAAAASAEARIASAWAAWHAAVEEGEDRAKAARGVKGKRRAGGGIDGGGDGVSERRLIGLRTWGWLALGVLVEELQGLERERVEVLTID
ncbi:hypothetical protein JCM3770_002050 [Rhodotorula araucariae]